MKYGRPDWDEDLYTDLWGDEPVFLLRARDIHSSATVRDWIHRAQHNIPIEMAVSAEEHAQAMDVWRAVNGPKVPDMPHAKEE